MQWSSQTDRQLADLVNRAHFQYRRDNFRPAHLDRWSHQRPVQQQPVYIQPQQPQQYQQHEPLRPRDVLLYGTWIAVVFGFFAGALWGVS